MVKTTNQLVSTIHWLGYPILRHTKMLWMVAKSTSCSMVYPMKKSHDIPCFTVFHSVSQCFTVFHSVSQCFTVFHSVSQCFTVIILVPCLVHNLSVHPEWFNPCSNHQLVQDFVHRINWSQEMALPPCPAPSRTGKAGN